MFEKKNNLQSGVKNFIFIGYTNVIHIFISQAKAKLSSKNRINVSFCLSGLFGSLHWSGNISSIMEELIEQFSIVNISKYFYQLILAEFS